MSTDPDTSPAGRLKRGAERPVRLIHTICQMILGLGLAIALILKVYMAVLTDHVCAGDLVTLGNAIRCSSTLMLLAYALAVSAGLELARRLVGEQSGRTQVPVSLALGAATLSVLGSILGDGAGWEDALVVVALVFCIGWYQRLPAGGDTGP